MNRILTNKLFYLFCWFTAAMVLCLYSTGLKAAATTATAHGATTTEIALTIASRHFSSTTTTSVSNLLPFDDSTATRAELTSNTHNLLNSGNLVAEKQVTCYPNPAISYINFKIKKPVKSNYKILIYSFTGRKMDELNITGPIMKMNLDDYYRGLYVYQLRNARGAVLESGKFQVKK